MSAPDIRILFTRPLSQDLSKKLAGAGIHVDQVFFIETKTIGASAILKEIRPYLDEKKEVIFTSQPAVAAVKETLSGDIPHWQIFCVGSSTTAAASAIFGKNSVVESCDYASELAEKIVKRNNVGTLLFFCGDQRRDDLPDILEKNGISLKEIIVYTTTSTPQKTDALYNGIVFCSPSAAASYFSQNVPDREAIIFCIGKTTAEAVRKFCSNRVVVADRPEVRSLTEKIIDHYSTVNEIKTENRTDDPT